MVAAKPPESLDDAQRLCDAAIATVPHATRCASNMNLGGSSPGSLACRHDMHLDIPLIADVHVLRDMRQAKIDERLLRSNASRIRHEWKVGQWAHVKKLCESEHKARPVCGPKRRVVQVHTNGAVLVQTRPGVVERQMALFNRTVFLKESHLRLMSASTRENFAMLDEGGVNG